MAERYSEYVDRRTAKMLAASKAIRKESRRRDWSRYLTALWILLLGIAVYAGGCDEAGTMRQVSREEARL